MKIQALLIGINEYPILPELKYARQDAEAIALALKQNYCFSDSDVLLLTDAKPGLFKPLSKHVIQTHLERLVGQELDLFIFGFWGHGFFRNGERYLCPLDVMSNAIEEQGFAFSELQRLVSRIMAKNTCMILDCCQKVHDRGEAETLSLDEQKSMENAARDIVLSRQEQTPQFQSNVAILNSCKEGQSAYEWDKRGHGVFTAHLIDAMNQRLDSVAKIIGYISGNVEKTAMELGKFQTPFYKLEGDIMLPVREKPTTSAAASSSSWKTFKNPLFDVQAKEKPQFETFVPRADAGERKTYTVNGVEFAFRLCPAGAFMMGSPESEDGRDDDETLHRVALTKDFWMLETPVTVGMFRAFVKDSRYKPEGNAPKSWTGSKWEERPILSWNNYEVIPSENYPVTCVSWNDAAAFCKWLSKKTEQFIQLPTEAQWEYACRAGSSTAFFWGDALNGDKANCNGNYPSGTTVKGNYLGKISPVGSYDPNAWGLYDMHGNVYEWCQDWYSENYLNETATDPTGSLYGSCRVRRGGGWFSSAWDCRSARRSFSDPEDRFYGLGFRCVKGR